MKSQRMGRMIFKNSEQFSRILTGKHFAQCLVICSDYIQQMERLQKNEQLFLLRATKLLQLQACLRRAFFRRKIHETVTSELKA
jgi:hypothetical protein